VESLSLHATEAGTTAVTLKGIGIDNLAVAQFVLALRQTKALDRVELKASVEQGTVGGAARSYLVECEY
jgi:Tfp pilus assembly protein PilN